MTWMEVAFPVLLAVFVWILSVAIRYIAQIVSDIRKDGVD